MDAQKLLIIASIVTIIALLSGSFVAYKAGYVNFIGKAHIWSLIMIIISSILMWAAMVWMSNPDKFDVTNKQKVALVASIFIGILYWARFAYVTAK